MSEYSARDPYVGLNALFRSIAAGQVPVWCVTGRVVAAHPLRVRAAGLDLEGDDLRVAAHLEPLEQETLAAGDEVLLIPRTDGQVYYLIDKLVKGWM